MRPLKITDHGNLGKQIEDGIKCYTFEKKQTLEGANTIIENGANFDYPTTNSVEESIHDWNKMIKITNILKEKYSFLNNFMTSEKINIVREEEYSDKILEQSGKVTEYDDDVNGIIYYIVQEDGKILKIPYEKIDKTSEQFSSENPDSFKGEIVGDFIDEKTRYILKHHYSSYGNDCSPLHVIPYIMDKK